MKLTPITSGDIDVTTPQWSPTGTAIAFLGNVPSLPPSWYPVIFEDPSDTPKVITRTQYKFDGQGWFDKARLQVFVVSPDGGQLKQLTHEATGVFHPTWTSERSVPLGSMAWSHDGRRIAFVMSTSQDEERDARCDIWTVEVESGALTRISPNDGLYGCPAWSPDDQQLAFAGSRLPKKGGANVNLWHALAAGSTESTKLDAAGMCIGTGLMSDSGAPGAAQVLWNEEGIYFGAASTEACRSGTLPTSNNLRKP